MSENKNVKGIWIGIGLLCLFHLLLFVQPLLFLAIGIVQVPYVIGLVLFNHLRRNTAIVQGVLIGAGITFLLNAACFGLVISGKLNL
jgi:hypothetical protein